MKLYVVQNQQGQFFRPRGYGGYSAQWHDQLEKAKFYPKLGTAKSQCVIWYKINPKLGSPHVLEFDLDPTKAVKIDMQQHAEESAKKKAEKEAKQKAKWEAEENRRRLEELKERVGRLSAKQRKEIGL